jgi:hypothetical protein
MRQTRDATFDALLQLKDAGAVAADGAATVGGQPRIVYLGPARADARVLVDVTATEADTGDETYRLRLQYSTSPSFASDIVNGPEFVIGDAAATGSSADTGAGRYEFGFTNEVGGRAMPYVRLFVDVSGTVTTGVNLTAFIALR